MAVCFTVNGEPVEVEPGTSLADCLRCVLRCPAPCGLRARRMRGACTVIVDGAADR
jgi:aerobic-type carbon monoxide dehydrogenase small subunit (CoxS/CutS family)